MMTGKAPESFTTQAWMSEFGTDEYSVLQLVYPGGITAHSLQTIGMQIDRNASILCSKGAVYIDDFLLKCRRNPPLSGFVTIAMRVCWAAGRLPSRQM